jgi:hypothetical protein
MLLTTRCFDQEAAADKFRYVMWGSFDEPEKVPPKGEFFCKDKPEWMPDIPGTISLNHWPSKVATLTACTGCFRKQEIKE